MNCASERCAIMRASVVLPVPGGPHRIIECSLPASMACRSGLPGASRCCWPTNSSSERGRMRSASGRVLSGVAAMRRYVLAKRRSTHAIQLPRPACASASAMQHAEANWRRQSRQSASRPAHQALQASRSRPPEAHEPTASHSVAPRIERACEPERQRRNSRAQCISLSLKSGTTRCSSALGIEAAHDDRDQDQPVAQPTRSAVQRSSGLERSSCAGVPITSTPAGGVKRTSSGATARVARDALENDGGRLAELVVDDHLASFPCAKPSSALRKSASAALRLDQHPLQAIARCPRA